MKKNSADIIALCITLVYATAAIAVSLHRFWQYEVFFYDFGIFDRVIWLISRFQAPIIDHLAIGTTHIFADHVSPSLFLLAPLYWFTSRSEILLIIQSSAVAASGYVLFRIGKWLLKNPWLSISITISYLLFVGVQNALISDFHEVTVMSLPFMLTMWMLIQKNWRWYFGFLILTLGCKESVFLIGIGIGILALLLGKPYRKIAIVTMLLSLVWGFVAIKIIIPYFSGGRYLYEPVVASSVQELFLSFFNHPDKTRTLWYSFRSFLFLPIFAPQLWALIFQDLITRYLPRFSELRWTLGLHYNVAMGAFLALGSVFALRKLQANKRSRLIVVCIGIFLPLNSIYLHQFKLHGPLGLAYNPTFYAHSKNFKFLDDLVSVPPGNVSVMTQNNIAVRFTHQPVLLLTPNYLQYMPDYILIDFRDGQSPNNYFPMDDAKIRALLIQLSTDPLYEKIYEVDKQFAFKKK